MQKDIVDLAIANAELAFDQLRECSEVEYNVDDKKARAMKMFYTAMRVLKVQLGGD